MRRILGVSVKRRKVYHLYDVSVRRVTKPRRFRYAQYLPTMRMCAIGMPLLSVLTSAMVIVGHSASIAPPTSTPTMHNTHSKHTTADEKAAAAAAAAIKANAAAIAKSAKAQAASSINSNVTLPPPAWLKTPLYVDPTNEATTYAQSNPTADSVNLIARAGQAPVATWFGDWDANVQSSVSTYVNAAASANAVPVVVLYNIPQRDCGNYSAGGVANTTIYTNWVRAASAGIGSRLAVVIVEPDALASADCLSAADQQGRYNALSQAVGILKAGNPNATVYLDAGNPAWQTAATMAARLRSANIAQADGFSLNVSNYVSTARNQSYGNQISALVGNKHYIIDTSRNGNSNISPDAWCNSPSAAFGSTPTTNTGLALNDALLWVKIPWESDGTCNGGPSAGGVFWSFTVQLARNAGW